MELYKNKPKRIYLDEYVYFVTSKTFDNEKVFTDRKKSLLFLETLKFLENRKDFELFAVCLLPDHFHLLVKPLKKNISEIMHDLKSYSAQKINSAYRRGILASHDESVRLTGEAGSLAYKGDGTGGHIHPLPVWQKSFYYHLILSDRDFTNHFNYIYYNPVKHNYVAESDDWPYLVINSEYKP